jgi:SHS2 domain-containing protein
MEKYKFLEHTADLKVVAFGKNIDEAFVNSALALKECISEKIVIKPKKSKVLSIEGKDTSALLYTFLEEFLYLLDAEDFVLSEIEDLEVNGDEEKGFSLSAKITGDKASSYKFNNSVKAITFNEMKISEDKKNRKWTVQFVLDV